MYCSLLIYYLIAWYRPKEPDTRGGHLLSVSVIVPARNEEKNIRRCIDCVLSQDYPAGRFECIVVDDFSDDATQKIVHTEFGGKVRILQPDDPDGGKKAALETGIRHAGGEIIVTTDADCTMDPKWLSVLVAQFTENVHLVAGPVVCNSANGVISRFQELDLLSLMVITAAGIRSGLHYLGNGANLAFRKQVFDEVGGYGGNMQYASGDDLFLIQKVALRFPGSLRFVRSRDAIVSTPPQPSYRAFINQRIRWASKNSALEDQAISTIWVGTWILHVLLALGLVISALFASEYLPLIFLLFACMVVAEYLILDAGAAFAGKQSLLWWFLPSLPIHYWYVLSMGFYTAVSREYEWKGRMVRKAPVDE